MNNFEFCSPTAFVFGTSTQDKTGEMVARFGGKKVLIHYGGGSVVKSGLLDEVKKSLQGAGIAFCELGGVQPNPRDTLVYKGIELCRKEGVDFLLAIGGGSTIDSTKAIALGVPYSGDFWDFYGTDKVAEKALPLGVVLTIPAAGSEGSPGTVITREEGSFKRAHNSQLLRPKFAIMNPEITYTLPAFQTACGTADIMAHIMERYFTRTEGVDVTDRLCESVTQTMIKYAPIAIADPSNYEARSNIMWAGMIAHNNLLGVGREEDWASHDIEHELSAQYDVAHGAGLAVVFPAWMRYQYKHDIMRFAQYAVRVWGCQMDFRNPERTALEGIDRLERFFKSIGLPITFKELGAKEEDIEMMSAKCSMNNGDKAGHFNPLTAKDIEEIYKLACK